MLGHRHDRVATAMHWGIGLALLAQIAFGFALDGIAPRGTPARGVVINLHKSVGVVLGLLIVARVLWRLRHPPRAWGDGMPAWQQRAVSLGHGALYVCMAVVPLAGYLASNFSRHGVKLFGHALPPWGPNLPDVYAALNLLHVFGAWVFTLLIAGHVAMALLHAFMPRAAATRPDAATHRSPAMPAGAAHR